MNCHLSTHNIVHTAAKSYSHCGTVLIPNCSHVNQSTDQAETLNRLCIKHHSCCKTENVSSDDGVSKNSIGMAISELKKHSYRLSNGSFYYEVDRNLHAFARKHILA